jgi:hypothetical protein
VYRGPATSNRLKSSGDTGSDVAAGMVDSSNNGNNVPEQHPARLDLYQQFGKSKAAQLTNIRSEHAEH